MSTFKMNFIVMANDALIASREVRVMDSMGLMYGTTRVTKSIGTPRWQTGPTLSNLGGFRLRALVILWERQMLTPSYISGQ